MLNKRYIKSIKRDIFVLISFPVFLFQFLFCYILERNDKKFKRDIIVIISFLILFFFDFFSGIYWKRNVPAGVPYILDPMAGIHGTGTDIYKSSFFPQATRDRNSRRDFPYLCF